MLKKDFRLHAVRTVNEKGELVALASTFHKVDSHGDIILPGAFTKTLNEQPAQNVRFLYQHDPFYPLGILKELIQTKDGLEMRAQFALGSDFARDKYELAKMGAFGGVSIGFTIPKGKSRIREDGVREISEIKLMEISLVTFPANEEAAIAAVKERAPLVRSMKHVFGLNGVEALHAAEGLSSLARTLKVAAVQAGATPTSRQEIFHSLQQLKEQLKAHSAKPTL